MTNGWPQNYELDQQCPSGSHKVACEVRLNIMQALSLMSSASTVIVNLKKKKKTETQSLGIKVALCVWELGFSLGQMTCKASTTSNGGFRNCKILLDFSGQQGREYGQANLHCLHPHFGTK